MINQLTAEEMIQDELNDFMKNQVIDSVLSFFNKDRQINEIIRLVLKDTELDHDMVLRRDFDGNSQLDWLIEKMIGEILTNGRINK